MVLGSEMMEVVVQSANANKIAKFLDWGSLKIYITLIFGNCVLVGICLLAPERFLGTSLVITIDVIVDVLYILFNINYIDSPSSYWAIIIPLWFAVDLINDSFTRAAQEQVVHLVVKRAR
jgi:hypothetical protein